MLFSFMEKFMNKLTLPFAVIACVLSAPVWAQNALEDQDPDHYLSSAETPMKNLVLVASSFDTFYYVDRDSVRPRDNHQKSFLMNYVQNGYRGLVVSQITAMAQCATPYRVRRLNEIVYQKHNKPNGDFELSVAGAFTDFPASDVVKTDNTIFAARFSFWGQVWESVCGNHWGGKHVLGAATLHQTIMDARMISKGKVEDTVIQKEKGQRWIYRTNTPPARI